MKMNMKMNIKMNKLAFDLFQIAKKERNRVWKNIRRARRAGTADRLTQFQWAVRLLEFNLQCAYCESAFETMDHIVPIMNGGGTVFSNVLPCCDSCNQLKGTAVWLPAHAGAYSSGGM